MYLWNFWVGGYIETEGEESFLCRERKKYCMTNMYTGVKNKAEKQQHICRSESKHHQMGLR